MAQPIRVVRIITRLNIGGPSIHAVLLSTRLDRDRFATHLVAGAADREEGDLSALLQGGAARLTRVRSLRRALHPWRDLVAFLRILRIIWSERPRLIHTHMAKAGALGRMAGMVYNTLGPGRHPGRRAILIHTFHGHVLEGYFPLWQSRLFVIIERWLVRRTDRCIAVSPAVRQALLALDIGREDRWETIPLGLDLSALAEVPVRNGSPSVRCGLVGRLVPIKNPGLFLEALSRLIRRGPEASVCGVVVGDGPLRAPLERQAARLGLGGRVAFLGWRRDLPSLYDQIDIACLTSWNEGTPVSVIEAMAAARAVVATDVGGVRDLLEALPAAAEPIPPGSFRVAARGLLVRPGDAEGLAAAVQALACDDGMRERVGRAARDYALQAFRAERLVEEMTALYERLAAEG